MDHTYSNIIGRMKYLLNKKSLGYGFPYLPVYNKVVGNIRPGYYTAVVGTDSCGKSSFVDNNYVLNTMLQWYFMEERPPLKIIYFSNKDSALIKYEKLLCAYAMMMENIRIDVPTLNSTASRLYDIDKNVDALNAMVDAKEFFNEIEDEEVLQIVDGNITPATLYNTVADYMGTIGDDSDPEQPYVLEDDQDNALTLIIIDSADDLNREDSYGKMSKMDAINSLIDNVQGLISRYGVAIVTTTSSDLGYIKAPNDTIPKYDHMGVYGKVCDRGVVIYDPIKADTFGKWFLPEDEYGTYVSNGINTLKYWYVVKNDEGPDLRHERMLFLPGTSFTIECNLKENALKSWKDTWTYLTNQEVKYE